MFALRPQSGTFMRSLMRDPCRCESVHRCLGLSIAERARLVTYRKRDRFAYHKIVTGQSKQFSPVTPPVVGNPVQ